MPVARKSLWARIERHLVDDWRHWHKWASVRWALLLLGLSELQEYLPGVKEYLPEKWVKYIAIAIVVARVLKGREAKKEVPPVPEKG